MPGRKHITRAASPALESGPGSWVSDAAREKFMAAYDRAFIKRTPPKSRRPS